MTAAACLRLAAVHLLVWFKQPARLTLMAFSAVSFVATSRLSLRWPERKHPTRMFRHFAGFTFRRRS
jgi:hypothetical protein